MVAYYEPTQFGSPPRTEPIRIRPRILLNNVNILGFASCRGNRKKTRLREGERGKGKQRYLRSGPCRCGTTSLATGILESIGEELVRMFTNNQRQEERTGKHGTSRLQYLQELVSQFQNATDEETKERIVANLGNFAYDPYNYTILRQLNVLELFVDCITEPNEKLVEFGMGGICNACAEPNNVATIVEADGIPLITKCLSSPVRNTVNYALGALYYMCDYNKATREEIVRAEVVDLIERYAAAESVSVSFSNLAKAFLDKHVHANI